MLGISISPLAENETENPTTAKQQRKEDKTAIGPSCPGQPSSPAIRLASTWSAKEMPSVQTDRYTINTRDTLGGGTDIMITDIERERPARGPNRASTNGTDTSTDGESEMEKLILVT
jgi:hypothetical protein